jgi:hypothetical protein
MQVGDAARPIATGLAIVSVGVLAGTITLLSVTQLRPILLLFALGGLILLIPPFLMRDSRVYWLFLLVASIPFDIHKSLTRWIVEPEELIELYGSPATGTASIDLYLTDAVLVAMVLPWIARLCLKRDRLYFPNVGYLFVLYLAVSLIVSLLGAEALSLALLELGRQTLYFVSFIYFINNIVTPAQLRAVMLALLVGLGVASGSVIGFSALGIGTDTEAFSALYGGNDLTSAHKRVYQKDTMYTTLEDPSQLGPSASKRSEGIFSHPGIAAAYCGLTVPVALALLITTRRTSDALLFGGFVSAGFLASYLTYSRAGLVALLGGCMVVFLAGRWARLVSQQHFVAGIFIIAAAAVASLPLLVAFLELRPESFSKRFEYLDMTIEAYIQRPILGAGLNNGTIAVKEGAQKIKNGPTSASTGTINSHYLIILTEGGLVGFVLFFGFIGRIISIGLGAMRAAETEMKAILVGAIGGLTSLATQNVADNAFGGHSISALLWLFLGLIVVISRRVRAGA